MYWVHRIRWTKMYGPWQTAYIKWKAIHYALIHKMTLTWLHMIKAIHHWIHKIRGTKIYDPDITAMIESYNTLCIDTQNKRDKNVWPSQNFNDEKVCIMHWIQKIRGTNIFDPHITSMIKAIHYALNTQESEEICWPSHNFNDEKVCIMHWKHRIRGTTFFDPHIISMNYALCIEYRKSEGQKLLTLT